MANRTPIQRLFQSILFITFFIFYCLSISANAGSEQKTAKQDLTCKYFDSFMKNHKECVNVYPSRKISVTPDGSYKDLYKAVFLLLNKDSFYKKAMANGNGIIEFISYAVNLNDGSSEEVILLPVKVSGKNADSKPSYLRGATGSGDILIFQKKKVGKPSKWQLIGELAGNLLRIEPLKNNGHYNLIVQEHGGYKDSNLTRYIFKSSDGKYRMTEEKRVSCEILSEKPCYQVAPLNAR